MKKFVCQNCHKLHKNSFDMNNDPNSSSGVFPAFADQKAVHNYGFICPPIEPSLTYLIITIMY